MKIVKKRLEDMASGQFFIHDDSIYLKTNMRGKDPETLYVIDVESGYTTTRHQNNEYILFKAEWLLGFAK